ncbi:hypothetical protein GGR32_000161 [Mesonia hippocampi]|uniref:Uncharacterized protein n=1 Tax=Mesonia hippocampi TaxID=1628250 RepID=A0A840EHJ0_9FLAO|nr:hypothetical protein [Mesonia hippocampi]MBB4117889.1 hypothetical protein [Mesonia hippocampi]
MSLYELQQQQRQEALAALEKAKQLENAKAIVIEQLNDDLYLVDGMQVHRDQSGNWIGNPKMNPAQIATFQRHLQAVENFGVTGKAEYKL